METLAARGALVSVVSRSSGRAARLAGTAHPVVADVTDAAAFARALDRAVEERGPISLALAYQPFAPDEAWHVLAARVEGLLVALLVSAYAAKDAPAPPLAEGRHGRADVRHLLLGWHRDAGGVRWHTPREVSAAAVGVADRGESAVLGVIRPWSERPGS